MRTAKLNKLLKDLQGDDAVKRRAAAEALAGCDDRAVYPLVRALKDDNLGVQDAAMQSLMTIKSEAAAYMLLPLLRDSTIMRNSAVLILREIGETAVPLLRTLLDDRDDEVRQYALNLLLEAGSCTFPEKVAHLLEQDRNANVRAAAARVLGKLKHKSSLPLLIKALDDDEWVCFSSLEALAQAGDESTVEPIVRLLKNPSETIRAAAVEALGNIASPGAIRSLTEHLVHTAGREHALTVKGLVTAGAVPSVPGVRESLLYLLEGDEWSDVITGVRGLAKLNDRESLPAVLDKAGSLDPSAPDTEERIEEVRSSVLAMGCSSQLIALLRDSSIRYRGKALAIELLGDMKCAEAVPDLIRMLKTDCRDIRRKSIESLGRIRNGEAEAVLISAVSDHDSHVRKAAVTALGKIGHPHAFEPIMAMILHEPYSDVLDEFIRALLKIDPASLALKVRELDDPLASRIEQRMAELSPESVR